MKTLPRHRAEPAAAACVCECANGRSKSRWERLTLLLLLVYGSQPQASSADLDTTPTSTRRRWKVGKKKRGAGAEAARHTAYAPACACVRVVRVCKRALYGHEQMSKWEAACRPPCMRCYQVRDVRGSALPQEEGIDRENGCTSYRRGRMIVCGSTLEVVIVCL